MADPSDDRPSLEMPSLSLRVRPRRGGGGRGGVVAAVVAGAAVGGLAVLLGWLAGVGCSALRGTSSCGGAVGLPLLLAGLVVLAYAGSVLLRILGAPSPTSTTMLGTGVLAVLVMVFLLGSLDQWWAALAVPAVAVPAYLVAWWVTTSVADDAGEGTPASYDVR